MWPRRSAASLVPIALGCALLVSFVVCGLTRFGQWAGDAVIHLALGGFAFLGLPLKSAAPAAGRCEGGEAPGSASSRVREPRSLAAAF
ncbi:MAG TPA: hypothetical protein VGY54_01325 [Polyangiaceae bacterium]|nr:hypothetical protein [Polyangiaceae bacterium]